MNIVSLNPIEKQKNIIKIEGAECPFCKNKNIDYRISGVLDAQCYAAIPNLQQFQYKCKDCGTEWFGNYYDDNWNHVIYEGEHGYKILCEAPIIREKEVTEKEGNFCPECKSDTVLKLKLRDTYQYLYECNACGTKWVGDAYYYGWKTPLPDEDKKYHIIKRCPKFNKQRVFEANGKICPSCLSDIITSETIEYDTEYRFVRFTCNECKTVWKSSVYDRDWNYVSEEYIPYIKHQDCEHINYKVPSKEAFSLISMIIWIICGIFLLEKTVELIEFGDIYTVLEMLFIAFLAILLISVIGIIKILCHNQKDNIMT